MKNLSGILDRGNNNFDLMRLAAALAVMLGHSYGIGGTQFESMLLFTHRESFGSLAVYAFFLISGILVSASYVKQSSPLRFVALRALRIWPGAIVCALFLALVVGPVFTRLPVAEYFSDWQTTARWLAHNTSLLGPVGGPLPGLFENNRLASLVNPTVWTLPVELGCYVVVLLIGLLGAISYKSRALVAVVLVGLAFAYFVQHPPQAGMFRNFFIIPIAYSFYPVPFFFLGALLYSFRENVYLHWLPALLLLAAYIVLRFKPVGPLLLYPAFVYALLWLASIERLRFLQPRHDYSYGIYLYGFAVQQVIASLYPTSNSYASLMVAIPVTVVLAALSWHLVERPCLSRLRGRTRAVPVPAISATPGM